MVDLPHDCNLIPNYALLDLHLGLDGALFASLSVYSLFDRTECALGQLTDDVILLRRMALRMLDGAPGGRQLDRLPGLVLWVLLYDLLDLLLYLSLHLLFFLHYFRCVFLIACLSQLQNVQSFIQTVAKHCANKTAPAVCDCLNWSGTRFDPSIVQLLSNKGFSYISGMLEEEANHCWQRGTHCEEKGSGQLRSTIQRQINPILYLFLRHALQPFSDVVELHLLGEQHLFQRRGHLQWRCATCISSCSLLANNRRAVGSLAHFRSTCFTRWPGQLQLC
mmetsp:Transcript_83197/g.156564  ORF Transcript_83197/g.156564 Transcript_83197/m.156564 type:complete len:278 (+) Transcript_83197:709-1542(+)